jgi:hypothetical protein
VDLAGLKNTKQRAMSCLEKKYFCFGASYFIDEILSFKVVVIFLVPSTRVTDDEDLGNPYEDMFKKQCLLVKSFFYFLEKTKQQCRLVKLTFLLVIVFLFVLNKKTWVEVKYLLLNYLSYFLMSTILKCAYLLIRKVLEMKEL